MELTLLTKLEYEFYMDKIPLIEDVWWLRTPGSRSREVYHVNHHGVVSDNSVISDRFGIRPALNINLNNSKSLQPGDKIRIGSKSFTVLTWKENELLALCDEFISRQEFDDVSNVWKTSKLKQWLETEGLRLIF